MYLKKNIYKGIVIIIGLIFILSAYSKLIDITEFSGLIYNYGFKNLQFLAPVIIIFELILGLHLFLFVKTKYTLIISTITLIVFTLIFSYGYLFLDIHNCGCFGNFLSNFLDIPLVLYIKNIILIILSILAYKKWKYEKNKDYKLKQIIIYSITGIAIFFAGFTFNKKQNNNYTIPSIRFLDKTTKDIGLSYLYPFNNDSTYITILFSYTCPHCLNTIANINLYKENNYIDNIVYLPVGGGQSKIDFFNNYKILGPLVDNESARISRISNTYPLIFFIKNNTVIFVNEGFLDAPLVFFKFNKLNL